MVRTIRRTLIFIGLGLTLMGCASFECPDEFARPMYRARFGCGPTY
jgi:hypothetical protein